MIRPIKMTHRDLSLNRRRTWGGSVLEAAFIVPILVSLAFGMAEFSYFFFVKHTLEGGAREGARNAITPSSTYTTALAAANGAITAAGFTTSAVTVAFKDVTSGATMNGTSWTSTTGDAIQATITATWSTIGVHPLGLIPGTKLVIGTCVMRKEG